MAIVATDVYDPTQVRAGLGVLMNGGRELRGEALTSHTCALHWARLYTIFAVGGCGDVSEVRGPRACTRKTEECCGRGNHTQDLHAALPWLPWLPWLRDPLAGWGDAAG